MKYTQHLLTFAGLFVVYYVFFVSTYSFNNLLGKAALLGAVLGVTHYYGRVAGVVSAAIAVLLLHKTIEGNQNMEDSKDADDDESKDDEKKQTVHEEIEIDETITVTGDASEGAEDSKGSPESDESEQVAQEKQAAAVSTNNIVAKEEEMRPKPSTSEDANAEGFTVYGNGMQSDPMALYSSEGHYAEFQ